MAFYTQITTPSQSTNLLTKIMSKRRTWAFLFISIYSILLSSSWNLLKSLLSWYSSTSSTSFWWPAIYTSVVLGVIFGVLAMTAALVVVVPATLIMWITMLVLLSFCGMTRKALVVEGKKLRGEISGFVLKVLVREGKFVVVVCAVLAYFLLMNMKEEEDKL